MGCSFCGKLKSEDYFIKLLDLTLIRKLKDTEYVYIIEELINQKQVEFESIITKPKRKITIESKNPEEFYQDIGDIPGSKYQINKTESGEIKQFNQIYLDILVDDNKEDIDQGYRKPNRIPSKKDIQKNLPNYIDSILDTVYKKYLILDSHSIAMNKKIDLTNSKVIKNQEDFMKQISNEFFLFLERQLTSYEMKINFIIMLLFLTDNSFHSISNCINKLYSLLKNKSIIRREGHLFYINNKQLIEVIEAYFKYFSYDIIEFASLLIPENESNYEFETYYKNIYSKEVLRFYMDTSFDFSFVEESSLAYFLKVIYPSFNSPESLYKSLNDAYIEFKSQNEEKLNKKKNMKIKSTIKKEKKYENKPSISQNIIKLEESEFESQNKDRASDFSKEIAVQ